MKEYTTNTSSLRKSVLIKEEKDANKIEQVGLNWLEVITKNKLSYKIDWLVGHSSYPNTQRQDTYARISF